MPNEAPSKLDTSTLLASTVHDMKNSLSIILNRIEELSEETSLPPQELQKVLKKLSYEGKRINNNLVQILSLYRIDNGQYFPNFEEHEVLDLLEEAVLENKNTLAIKGISIELACDEALMWFFDRNLILGIINTTLNNAYKYASSKIALKAFVENGQLTINVSDDGPGYPPNMLIDKKSQKNIDFSTGSTGLGLYFAKVVAESHRSKASQGSISISNTGIDGGGNFSITLP
ncbi:sensor histidine kinase [Pseudomonadota bacterium]